jgi:hypothetical protein
MAQTGHIRGRDCSVKVVCGAGTINLSAHGNSIDIDLSADDIEVTAFNDTAHTFMQGLTNFNITYNGWWSGSHATNVLNSEAACLQALIHNSSASVPVVWVSPAGSAAGSICYVACANVQATPVSIPSDGIVSQNATFTARAGSLTACGNSIWA